MELTSSFTFFYRAEFVKLDMLANTELEKLKRSGFKHPFEIGDGLIEEPNLTLSRAGTQSLRGLQSRRRTTGELQQDGPAAQHRATNHGTRARPPARTRVQPRGAAASFQGAYAYGVHLSLPLLPLNPTALLPLPGSSLPCGRRS
jgi:hypothetical protein